MKVIIHKGEKYFLILLSREEVLSVPGTKRYHLELGLMMISENKIYYHNIPQKFLKYVCIHEVECPDMTQGGGIDALKVELEKVPSGIFDEYIQWRRKFFENILNYWENLTIDHL